MEHLQTHKCPCCGGTVQYDSSLQKVKCPYCDTEFNMKDINSTDEKRAGTALDITKESIKSGGQWSEGEAEGIKHYICQSCGGEIIADSTAALSCPYCGHAAVSYTHLRKRNSASFSVYNRKWEKHTLYACAAGGKSIIISKDKVLRILRAAYNCQGKGRL